jgi:hypothetical protein
MNKTLVIASVLMAAALTTGIFSTNPMAAYADDDDEGDYSGTNTEQKIKQKNVGGDFSSQFNCAENNIGGAEDGLVGLDIDLCGTLDVGVLDGGTPTPIPGP